MKKILGTICLVIYAIVAVTVTVLLLSYNEYRYSEVGGYTFYIISDRGLEPDYLKGDLVLIEGTTERTVEPGDRVFMYRTISSKEYEVICDTVNGKSYQGNRTILELQNYGGIDSTYLIGEEADSQTFRNLGTILGILESKWGFLFLVVIPSLFLFLQQVFELYIEIRYGSEETKEK